MPGNRHHQLFYAAQCPNCMRFLGALDRTPQAAQVRRIDVNTLTQQQRGYIHAVPMLVLNTGAVLTGTQAFQWLKEYEQGSTLDSFDLCAPGLGRLAFSDFGSADSTILFSSAYSQFEPVP